MMRMVHSEGNLEGDWLLKVELDSMTKTIHGLVEGNLLEVEQHNVML